MRIGQEASPLVDEPLKMMWKRLDADGSKVR